MPEIHLKQLGFTYNAYRTLIKKKSQMQKFREKADSKIKHYSNFIWLMMVLKISLEEQLSIKFHMIKHLKFIVIIYVANIKDDLLQSFIKLLMKNLKEAIQL